MTDIETLIIEAADRQDLTYAHDFNGRAYALMDTNWIEYFDTRDEVIKFLDIPMKMISVESEDEKMTQAQIITAPSKEEPIFISVFLAGGITNCKEWQKDIIDELDNEYISIFNPRQEHFDISDKNASYKQILWEFERLEKMDIFSMYFCNDNSDQPICMYELGRNIVRMQNRFPSDWENRIVISVEDGYKRAQDVLIQTQLCTKGKVFVESNADPKLHAEYIKEKIEYII